MNFFDISNAYRDSLQKGEAESPRTGSDMLERLRSGAGDAGKGAALANYIAMTTGKAINSQGSGPYKGDYGDIRKMGQAMAAERGWTGQQWADYDRLVMKESGWNPRAQNPTSTAYGIGQFLDSTWGSYGPKTSDPKQQIAYMLDYITGRYGDPTKALQFHLNNNWY